MSKQLSLIVAFLVFFLFILLSVTPSLWASEQTESEWENDQTYAEIYSFPDFESELKAIESGEQMEKNQAKLIEEKEMMADLITDEVQNEQSSIQKKSIQDANQETLKTLNEPERILPSTSSMKKRRVRSR
jgi:hypothetical protein